MDYEFEVKWKKTVKDASIDFGDQLDLQSLLFIIGFQESGQAKRKFSKNQKVDLMHIAICTLLEPYGYYEFMGKDEDNWPHFERKENLPPLSDSEQEKLIKKSIINYLNYDSEE